jgi:hypothetical protein
MSRPSDPVRITDLREAESDFAELKSGIRVLRRQDGSAAETDALAARLGPQLATNVVAGTALVSSALLRFAMLGVGVVGLSMGAWWLWSGGSEQVAQSPAKAAIVQPFVAAPAAPQLHAAAVAVAAPQQAAVERSVLGTPGKPRVRDKAAPRAPQATTEKPRSGSDPEAELVLLGRAQALLDSDPDGALGVLGEHARDYARGVFIEEREVLALEAESKLGHKALARARAERFIERFPRSAHARRVRTLLEPAR